MSVLDTQAQTRARMGFFYGAVGVIVFVLFTGLAYRQLLSGMVFSERERLPERPALRHRQRVQHDVARHELVEERRRRRPCEQAVLPGLQAGRTAGPDAVPDPDPRVLDQALPLEFARDRRQTGR